MIGRLIRKHWQVILIGILIPVLLALPSIIGFAGDWLRRRPVVTKIIPESSVVRSGGQLKLHAETYPPDIRPSRYDWSPPENILFNGQQLVILDTKTSERHTAPYQIQVSLTPIDVSGNPLPTPSPVTITVEPESNKPRILRRIHTSPETQVIRAGDSIIVEALADDDDPEDRGHLTYNWYVKNDAAEVEDNGKPRAKLITRSDLAKYAAIPLVVSLTVTDTHNDASPEDSLELQVVPKARGRYIIHPKPQPASPQAANQNAAPPLPATHPDPSPTKHEPQETEKSPQATPAPTKQPTAKDRGR